MIELQQIFQDHIGKILSLNLPSSVIKAVYDIEAYRTSFLGSHIDNCPECDHIKISYNSCRNRHCPKCQSLAKEEWIEARRSELINTNYFHVVYTVPDKLNSIIYKNQKLCYDLMFKCVSETMSELSRDSKYLGAEIGTTAVLHTWGQNLMYHPHIHCIVPGGGLSNRRNEFIKSKRKFFIPVKVLSRKFRGKFMFFLNKFILEGKVKVPEDLQWTDLKDKLYKKDWVVYCKKPFKKPDNVIKYLGRYTHRIAISNHRIASYDNKYVVFKWKDYRNNNKEKLMKLDAVEFLRRFLLHVLPDGFRKIRHYGILSNRNKKTKLKICQRLTNVALSSIQKLTKLELLKKIFGMDVLCCPKCGCERLNRFFIPPDWAGT